METSGKEYFNFLKKKYHPLRRQYLNIFFYPKILKYLDLVKIVDLGCGTGEFMLYLQKNRYEYVGIEANPDLVNLCLSAGLNVLKDDILTLERFKDQIDNGIIDNVLEHLSYEQIESFFILMKLRIVPNGTLVVIVPNKKGYKTDPTHVTFIDDQMVSALCKKFNVKLSAHFYHPFPILKSVFYLNMQVFILRF